jgi:hypothetical protein
MNRVVGQHFSGYPYVGIPRPNFKYLLSTYNSYSTHSNFDFYVSNNSKKYSALHLELKMYVIVKNRQW